MNNIGKINIRKATHDDVAEIVRMLADDRLGEKREQYTNPLPHQYYAAFNEIDADKNNYLIVAEIDNKVIGTLQLTLIPYLTYQGGKRALIEAVRIDSAYRGKGIGKILFEWAITKSGTEGCHLVQLTTDKERPDALEFYKKLGFVPSHEGLKLFLSK
jgi:GNAT superfamily N-acetyltransferase